MHEAQAPTVPQVEHAPHDVFPNPVVVDAVADHVQPGTVVQKVVLVVVKPRSLHKGHEDCPGMGEEFKLVAQAVPDDTPEPQEKPAAQGVGLYTPVPEQKEPVVQVVHTAAPAAEKVPALHGVATAAPAAHEEPAGHTTCALLPTFGTGQ
jgi:hypothetical protein